MLYHSSVSPPSSWRRLAALSCLSVLVLGAGQADALPRAQLRPAPGLLLVQSAPSDSEQRAQDSGQAALAALDEVLKATRARIEAAATELRAQLQAFRQENESLAAELQPDIWVKGGDYSAEQLPEREVLAQWGGQAVTVPYLRGRSTTQLVRSARANSAAPSTEPSRPHPWR